MKQAEAEKLFESVEPKCQESFALLSSGADLQSRIREYLRREIAPRAPLFLSPIFQ